MTGPTRIVIGKASVARAVLIGIALWGLANVLWLARDILFVAFLATLLAAFLSIFVDQLVRRGVPRGIASPLVLIVLLLSVATVVMFVSPTLIEQIELLSREVPRRLQAIVGWLEARYDAVVGGLGGGMSAEERLRTQLLQGVTGLVSGTLPLLSTLVGSVTGVFVILFAAVYLSIDPEHYRTGLVRLAPPRLRPRLRDALLDTGVTMQRWMVATLISMSIIAVMTTAGLMLLGIPAALALGLLAGALQFIPTFGPVLSSVPAAAIGFMVSPLHALWVLLLFFGTQQVESNMMTPLIMKRAVDLPPALTILAQALMTVLFGFLGLLVAVPLVAVSMVLVRRLYIEPLEAAASTE
jgi:predicted PurR-regulated permease PerM